MMIFQSVTQDTQAYLEEFVFQILPIGVKPMTSWLLVLIFYHWTIHVEGCSYILIVMESYLFIGILLSGHPVLYRNYSVALPVGGLLNTGLTVLQRNFELLLQSCNEFDVTLSVTWVLFPCTHSINRGVLNRNPCRLRWTHTDLLAQERAFLLYADYMYYVVFDELLIKRNWTCFASHYLKILHYLTRDCLREGH